MATKNTQKIGWIGMGRMGFPMAERLIKAGHDVTIWNRTRAKAEPLAKIGGKVVDHLYELKDVDVLFSIVATGKDVQDVLYGKNGVCSQGGKMPPIVVDCSTIAVEESAAIRDKLKQLGADFVASPVSGNAKVIKAGKLSAVVSGPEAACKTATPLIEVFAPRGASYVGDGELARVCKIAHNVMLGVVIENLIEITLLTNKMGVPRHAFLAFLNNGVMGSMFTAYKSPALVNLDWTTTFTPELLRKDLDLGLELAREMDVPMPVTAATREVLQGHFGAAMLQKNPKEYLEKDFAALAETMALAAGMKLESENKNVPTGLENSDSRVPLFDIGLHADRYLPLTVALDPDARGLIPRPRIVRQCVGCDHGGAVVVNRQPHGLDLADRHRGVVLLLAIDRSDASSFGDRRAAAAVEHELVGDVLRPFGGIVTDGSLLDRLERIDDVLLGRRAHAVGNRLTGIFAIVRSCSCARVGRRGARRIRRGQHHLLAHQRAPGAFLLRPDVEKEHVAAVGGFAVAGDHGDAAVNFHHRIAWRGGDRGFQIGKEILALANLAVGVDEGELQRKELAGDRFVVGTHGRAERLIGFEHQGVFAWRCLRPQLDENRNQRAGDNYAEPPSLRGATHHPSWKNPAPTPCRSPRTVSGEPCSGRPWHFQATALKARDTRRRAAAQVVPTISA